MAKWISIYLEGLSWYDIWDILWEGKCCLNLLINVAQQLSLLSALSSHTANTVFMIGVDWIKVCHQLKMYNMSWGRVSFFLVLAFRTIEKKKNEILFSFFSRIWMDLFVCLCTRKYVKIRERIVSAMAFKKK